MTKVYQETDLPPGLEDWDLTQPFELKVNNILIDFSHRAGKERAKGKQKIVLLQFIIQFYS
jgi:hypothetical protein